MLANKENHTSNLTLPLSFLHKISLSNLWLPKSADQLEQSTLSLTLQLKSGSQPSTHKLTNRYISLLNSPFEHKDQIPSYSLHQKTQFARGLATLLRNFILSQRNNTLLRETTDPLIYNVMAYIVWTQEPILINLYGYYLLEFLKHDDLYQLSECLQLVIDKCAKITVQDQYRLIFSTFCKSDGQGQFSKGRSQVRNFVESELCAAIVLKGGQSENYLQFLINLLTSSACANPGVVKSTISTLLLRISSPFQTLSRLFKPFSESRQQTDPIKHSIQNSMIQIIVRKRLDEKIIEILRGLLQFHMENDWEGQERILDVIFQMSTEYKYILPIQHISDNWTSKNNHPLFYLCCIYKTCFCQHFKISDLSKVSYMVSRLKPQQLVKYQGIVLQIVGKIGVLIGEKTKEFSSCVKVQQKLAFARSNDNQNQEGNLSGYLGIVKLLTVSRQMVEVAASNLKQRGLANLQRQKQSVENKQIINSLLSDASYSFLIQFILQRGQLGHNVVRVPLFEQESIRNVLNHTSTSKDLKINIILVAAINLITEETEEDLDSRRLNLFKRIINVLFQNSEFDLTQGGSIINILKSSQSTNRSYFVGRLLEYIKKNQAAQKHYSSVANILASFLFSIKSGQLQPPRQWAEVESTLLNQDSKLQQLFISHLENILITYIQQIQSESRTYEIPKLLTIFLELFCIYREYYTVRIASDLQRYYIRFFETTSLLLSFVEKIGNQCRKRNQVIEQVKYTKEQLNEALTIDTFSALDIFLQMDDDFQKYDMKHYVDVTAKQIHLIARNTGESRAESWEGEYEEFCIKSVRIIERLKRLEIYLQTKNDQSYRVGTVQKSILLFGEIQLSNDTTMYQLKCLMTNLDTLIYYCEQLIPESLPVFVGVKVSIAVYFDEFKDYQSLEIESKIRVISQILPLLRTHQTKFQRWIYPEVFNRPRLEKQSIHTQSVKNFYTILEILFVSPNQATTPFMETISPHQTHITTLLKYYMWQQHDSISLSQRILQDLFNTATKRNNSVHKELLKLSNGHEDKRARKELMEKKVMDMSQERLNELIFQTLFDLDACSSSLFSDYLQRGISLLKKKNQISRVKQVVDLGKGAVLKCYSLRGALTVIEHSFKQLDFSRVFDSTLRILKEYVSVNIQTLNQIGRKLFNKNKSVSCGYTIDTLAKDLHQALLSKTPQHHPCIPLFQTLIRTILAYFGDKHSIQPYIISRAIDSLVLSNQYQNIYSHKLKCHFQKQELLSQKEISELKAPLLRQYYKEIHNDYPKAMQYHYLLGRLHSESKNTFLSNIEITELAVFCEDLNYLQKTQLLQSYSQKDYLARPCAVHQEVTKSAREFKTHHANPLNKPLVLQIIKNQKYPVVIILPFGDQMVTVIIMKNIQVHYSNRNQFMDLYKLFQQAVNDSDMKDKRMKVSDWWARRVRIDRRMQAIVGLMSDIKEVNFLSKLYDQNQSSSQKLTQRFEVILLVEQSLQNFPYEMMKQNSKHIIGVYRIPSIRYLIKQYRNPRRNLLISNLSYLLSPEYTNSQFFQEFASMKGEMPTWTGKYGNTQSPEEYLGLLKKDLFLSIGNANSHRIDHKQLYRSQPRASPLLCGGFSARMVDLGGSEPYGLSLTYLISGAGLLLGFLWDASHKQMVQRIRGMLGMIKKQKIVDMAQVVAWSRDLSNLKYLQGSAGVLYGIPYNIVHEDV